MLRNVKFVIQIILLHLCYTKHRTETANGQNYTNYESNLAMIVISLPVKFKFDWLTDQTNKWNYTNFESYLAMMVIYLPVKFELDWTNVFQVRVHK